MFRMSLISYTCCLKQFVLYRHKESRLFYSYVIKMQLKIIDLKKNSTKKKKHCLWFQAEVEKKAQSIVCCGTVTFVVSFRRFINVLLVSCCCML